MGTLQRHHIQQRPGKAIDSMTSWTTRVKGDFQLWNPREPIHEPFGFAECSFLIMGLVSSNH